MSATRDHWSRRAFLGTAAIVLGSLPACTLTRPAPIKGTYVLEPARPPAVAKAHPGSLRLGNVAVGAPYRGRAFIFRETDLKYETDYYHEFLVSPAANIGEATVRALSGANVFTSVAPAGVVSDTAWVLDGFVNELYGDARNLAKPVAVLSISYFLRRDGDAVPIWSKTYERRTAFTAGSVAAYVEALNVALAEILAELTRDLAALSLPQTG
jgi:cholesterol transport system auxiliary component